MANVAMPFGFGGMGDSQPQQGQMGQPQPYDPIQAFLDNGAMPGGPMMGGGVLGGMAGLYGVPYFHRQAGSYGTDPGVMIQPGGFIPNPRPTRGSMGGGGTTGYPGSGGGGQVTPPPVTPPTPPVDMSGGGSVPGLQTGAYSPIDLMSAPPIGMNWRNTMRYGA